MNNNTGIIIGVAAILVIAGGLYIFNNDDSMEEKKEVDSMSVEDKMPAEPGNEAQDAGTYEAYDRSLLARAETGDVVLFFHASWCPSCRALGSDIEKNADSIPMGVSILKTDYDKETELKQKYGITYQHTLVQVDKDGNMIKKWSGSPNLNSLLSQIK